MIMSSKTYDFDKKLYSLDIKYIERIIVDNLYLNFRCDRCNANLIYVNILRIEINYHNLGDFCYQSVKNILSDIRGKSLHFIRLELEESYDTQLLKKYATEEQIEDKANYKWDPDYSQYLILKWDLEHGGLPTFRKKEFDELKKKFGK